MPSVQIGVDNEIPDTVIDSLAQFFLRRIRLDQGSEGGVQEHDSKQNH